MRIDEDHQREQYFFDGPTTRRLADLLARFEHPCCLCAPRVGQELVERGRRCRTLDIDERFGALEGFSTWDLYRPLPLDTSFDVILCDPPFNRVSLSQLFRAVGILAQGSLEQPLALCYLARRSGALLGTFAPFGLEATGLQLGYVSVRPIAEHRIELFTNFPIDPV